MSPSSFYLWGCLQYSANKGHLSHRRICILAGVRRVSELLVCTCSLSGVFKKKKRSYMPLLFTEVKWSEIAESCLTLCNSMDSSLHQAPLSRGFSRQEYWTGLPFASPGNLTDPGIEPGSPTLIDRRFTVWATGGLSFRGSVVLFSTTRLLRMQ